jgi:hypothetical protein
MSDITYPRPDNVRGKFGRWVTADLFHIAQRIQEVDPRLFIQSLDPPTKWHDQTWNYVIVEVPDGMNTEQWVYGAEALDARVVEHVQYLMTVPFSERFAIAEKLEAKREADEQDRQLEEALENWGYDFRKQLAHDGFITHTGKSYAKRGVAAPGHARG